MAKNRNNSFRSKQQAASRNQAAAQRAALLERGKQIQKDISARSDVMFYNKLKNSDDNASYRGFMSATKDLYTGRNRGKDRTQVITESYKTSTMQQAFQQWQKSDSGQLFEAVYNIDEQELLSRGFSQSYIDELRAMTKKERYEEAKAIAL